MSKTYDEDDISKLAKLIGEEFSDKLNVFIEDIDGRIARHVTPLSKNVSQLEQDIKIVKAAVKDTNKDLKGLDRAVGNVEHKLDSIKVIAFEAYRETGVLDKRVSRLEVA